MEACLIFPFETTLEEVKEAKIEMSKRQSKSIRSFNDKATIASIDPYHDNFFSSFTIQQK